MNLDKRIKLDTVIEKLEKIPTVDLDGEIGMMSIENGKYYGLDLIGSQIWSLIGSPNSIENMVNTLCKEYDVDRKTCEEDLLEFINKLIDEKLVRIVNK